MAEIKNFGLVGVGDNVQLGKAGPRLKVNAGVVEARTASDSDLAVVRGANAVSGNDLVTFDQMTSQLTDAVGEVSDGFKIALGNIEEDGDGSWQPGAVSLNNTTKISDAVDSLNEILGKLIPTQPPAFPNGVSLALTNSAGSSPRLASGVTDNASSGTAAGAAVVRHTASNAITNIFQDVGSGESGTISLYLNGSVVGSREMTGDGDAGTYNGLVIADQKDFPVSTPGFWKSVDVSANVAAPEGINKFRIIHTDGGQSNELIAVRDAMVAVPSVSNGSVAQATEGTLSYSSGVPHYGDGASLTVGMSVSNLSGETYYGGNDPITISGSNGIITADVLTYTAVGISTPIARNTTAATAITPVTVAIDGANVHHMGRLSALAKNVNGSSTSAELAATNILVKRGTTNRIDEMSVPVTGLGSSPNNQNAVRVLDAGGDKPTLPTDAWVSTSAPATHSALVVGGVLKHDKTNYTAGHLPVGPDLSVGRDGAQYVTFRFNRTALSQFKINITGSYAGCWVALPGVSNNSSLVPNGGGWWDGFKPYDGAGVPGESGDSLAGCAAGTVMSGGSGTYTMTFGTQSSTNATGNTILVRFRLNAGQSITALSFTN